MPNAPRNRHALAATLLLAFALIPMLWMLSTSLKGQFAALAQPPEWIPTNPTLQQYQACVDSQKYIPQIRGNLAEAARRGVSWTPTFIIGTKQVRGAISYDEFKADVDEALAQARASTKTPATPATKSKTAAKRG